MPEFQTNYLAVGVAALATILIGALWYSPLLFGNIWLKATGYTQEQMREKTGYEVEQRPVSYGSSRWHVVMLNHPLPPFLCFRLDHPLKRAFRMRPIRLAG